MATTVRELPDGSPDESGLTPRQQAILRVIEQTTAERGYPPSVREIGHGVGLTSSSSVAHQLRTLEELGYLRKDPNRPRALVVSRPGELPTTTAPAAPAANTVGVPWSAESPLVGRSWPNSTPKRSCPCPRNSSVMVSCSCSLLSVIR